MVMWTLQKSLSSTHNKMKIYGLSVLENSLKGNTCFRESAASLLSFCDETHLFIKKSVDGTEAALKETEHFHLNELNENEGASEILQQLREDCENIPGAWCLFLETDEVLNLVDLELLREDIKRASSLGCEAISFRNLNFANDPHQILISEDSSAHSIRLFRLGSNDYFQSEEEIDEKKVYFSEVKLFNYSLLRKEKEGLEISYSKKGLIPYLASHPPLMKRRVENWGGAWDRLEVAKVYILGEPRDFRAEFIEKIKAKKVIWAGNIVEIPAEDRPKAIIIKPTIFQKVFRSSKVPKKMSTKGAHDWTLEFILTLKLSEKGVAVG